MNGDMMTFPNTVEEFMESYKVVDSEGIYMSKGSELVPIFRMKQWFEYMPSAQRKGYTKADYIMALHKEYGCSLARAEEAHQKALEYLRNMSMMKG